MRVGVLTERIWVTLPTLIVGSGVENMLWWRVKALKGVSMLNGGRAIAAFN